MERVYQFVLKAAQSLLTFAFILTLFTDEVKMELHVFQYFRLSRNPFGQDFSTSHVKLRKKLSFSYFFQEINLCCSHLINEQFQMIKKYFM